MVSQKKMTILQKPSLNDTEYCNITDREFKIAVTIKNNVLQENLETQFNELRNKINEKLNRLVITFFCFSIGGAIAQVLVSLTYAASGYLGEPALGIFHSLCQRYCPMLLWSLFMGRWCLAAAGVTIAAGIVTGHWDGGYICHFQCRLRFGLCFHRGQGSQGRGCFCCF